MYRVYRILERNIYLIDLIFVYDVSLMCTMYHLCVRCITHVYDASDIMGIDVLIRMTFACCIK